MSASDRGFQMRISPGLQSRLAAQGRRPWLPVWVVPRLAALACDGLAVAGTAWIIAASSGTTLAGGEALQRIGGIAAMVTLLLGFGSHAYSRSALLRPPVAGLLKRWGMVLLLVCAPAMLVLPVGTLSASGMVLLGMLAPVALLACREALALGLAAAFRWDWLPRRSIVVLARTRAESDALARLLRREVDCRRAVAATLFDCDSTDLAEADLVVVQASGIRREDISAALAALRAMPGAASFVTESPPLQRLRTTGDAFGGCAVFARKRAPLTRAERCLKRSFDVVVAGSALLLLAPLLLAVSAVLWVRGARPVLRRRPARDVERGLFSIPEFTPPPGRFLATDEPSVWDNLRQIPALCSVLAGHLSLVGPRPLAGKLASEDANGRPEHGEAGDEMEEDDQAVARYAARQGLKPGLAQSESRAARDGAAQRADDLAYCDQWSFGLDLAVLASQLAALCVEPSRPPR
jgi:lipopolysaccharide/colanic/teichoic acid biosynthesis glycosyltransferase